MHDDAVPGPHARRVVHQPPCGQPLRQERDRLGVVDPVRHRESVIARDDSLLGVPTVVDERSEPQTLGGTADHLESRHQRRRGGREVAVLAHQRVGEVHPAPRHVDEHLARPRLRLRQFAHDHDLRPAQLPDLHSTHDNAPILDT
jgi:hypothetical protein